MRKTGILCFLLAIAISFSSCGGDAATDSQTDNTAEAETASLENPEPEGPTYDVPFPVWSEVEELQQLFSQKNDSTYVINFWATWCKPCIKELPYFEKLNEELKDEKVRVVLVSLDFDTDVETKLKKYVEENELKSEVIAFINGNYNSWIGEIEEQWDGAIPITIIYNANDRKLYMGELDSYEELNATVESMIKA